MPPAARGTLHPAEARRAAMADFEIRVKRGKTSGTMEFTAGDVSVSTTCWWDPDVKIDANEEGYLACATHMANKPDSLTGGKRPGLWFGKGIKYAHGTKKSNGIFIHEGKNAAWSDGCIVADRAEVLKIWTAINPKEQFVVSVKVEDVTA
jgi:hypothetical protein